MPRSSSSLAAPTYSPLPSLRVVPRNAPDKKLGPLALALSSGYGLTADPWQADPVECALLRRRDGRFAAATVKITVSRQNGKNAILEILELFHMVVLGSAILHTAHEVKTARKAFRRILSFFENEKRFPELFRLVKEIRKTNGQEAIFLHAADCSDFGHGNQACGCSGGGSIEFIARSKGSGRGFTVDVLVLDEDQDLTDDELAALLPTISSAPHGNPQVILTGTPPDPEKQDAAKGEVARRVRKEGIDGTDPNLACFDWGVPDGPLPDVDDRKLWATTNPALGGRLKMAELERERKLMSPEKFARERLGWWGDPKALKSAIFGGGRWEATDLGPGEPPDVEGIGLAVSLDLEWGSIGGAGSWDDGRINLGAVDRREGTAWLVDEAARIQDEYGVPVLVDEKCPDASLIPALVAAGVAVTVVKIDDHVEAVSELVNYVKAEDVTHLSSEVPTELDQAVAAAAWRMVGDRKLFGRKQSKGDVSMLEACCLAFFAVLRALDYDVEDSFL